MLGAGVNSDLPLLELVYATVCFFTASCKIWLFSNMKAEMSGNSVVYRRRHWEKGC